MSVAFAMEHRNAPGFASEQTPALATSVAREGANPLAAFLALIGLIIPAAEMQIQIAGAKFTVGRLGIILLFVPAVVKLLGKGRRLLLPDLLVAATAIWIVVAAIQVDGTNSLSSAGAEAIELLGGYVAARAYFFGSAALKMFLRVLAALALLAIVFGLIDRITGRLFIHEFFGSLTHIRPIDAQERMGVLRATSTFDHAILFGLFCAAVGAMLLYSQSKAILGFAFAGVCLFGVYLSLSSSGLMAFAILLFAYAYERIMQRFPWRWSLCWAALILLTATITLVTQNPLGWVLTHLTLDPESGYFRLLEWQAGSYFVSQSPWTGYAFRDFAMAELYSVDSVWLAFALRFGLPMVTLLFLANVALLLPSERAGSTGDPFLDRMRTSFSVVLVMYMFVGLTAHFWNYMWIFWGICLGAATSLREYALLASACAWRLRPAAVENAPSPAFESAARSGRA